MADFFQDLFDTGALEAGWSRRNIVTGDETWGSPGLTTNYNAAGDFYLRAAPASGDFTVELQYESKSSGTHMFGPVILTDAGSGRGSTGYNGVPTAVLNALVTTYSYGSDFSQVGTTALLTGRLRLRKAGTSYYTSYSTDGGGSWSAETAAEVFATAPTTVGFGGWLNTGTVKVTEFLVTVPGVSTDMPVMAAGAAEMHPLLVPIGTDTSNRMEGFRLGGYVVNEAAEPAPASPPAIYTHTRRDDMALYLPPPTIVDGRIL